MPVQLKWENSCFGKVPPDAVQAGWSTETDEGVFVGRVFHKGDLIPGRIQAREKALNIGKDNEESAHDQYEVLTNPDNKPLAFVLMFNGNVPYNGVEGGKTESGETLFIGITEVPEAGILPGKIQQSKKGLFVPFDGKELFFSEYKVLICKE